MKKDYNFGYTKVNPKQKTKLVQNVFSSVAPNYDIMNDLMSLGMHRLWKKRFVEIVEPKDGEIILDVGSGSGDIASQLIKKNKSIDLFLLDLNKKMLDEGRKRFKENKFNFIVGNAEKLNFPNNNFDKYTISFCLRNITKYKKSIKEAYRVLKPGGWAILQIPFFYPLKEKTFEDFSITDPKERERVFGQDDHVRMYGKDYPDRIRKSGLKVIEENFVKTLSKEEIKKHALPEDEIIYRCEKK